MGNFDDRLWGISLIAVTTERRREELDLKVRIAFEMSGRTYGSPRVHARLRADGEQVSPKETVAASMARQGLVGTPQTAS